ncbi:predicted protein [Scheffersomyces stipitis CBS 6054]|uniref:Uncharacterized protein n=1 Tax=Scheffersomyces stipitis (strain ATCC 58785 / CBS 6054 / NBRC 10063 / NRRL Y-11545) TaxID=322104 RepID=A3LWL4_PICST|nr:predicted protein [Scheffersomyces stipitis CBS 6054]ABN67304.2 predicted protein [Scheffersomyces stipitis CBS 6054]KAG2734383.1 hypothetical protein G9P44_002389 [Scheffersomyces stipitis]
MFSVSRRVVTVCASVRSTAAFSSASAAHLKHKANFKSSDSTIETDEIISENNPWSPTLYNDVVYVHKPNSLRSTALPDNYRLSYSALYEAPGGKHVGMLKRLTLSFAVLGIYGAKLFYESTQFEDIYALGTLVGTFMPAAIVQYKTRDYVTRIFRLYDKEKPQTLENLVGDEKLICEKLNFTGSRTVNELLHVSGNKSLSLSKQARFPLLAPYSTWEEIDPESNKKRHYFVVDNLGGLKMDRIWGIIEKNSGVNNGRFIDESK